MTDNASTSPSTSVPKSSNGNASPAPLSNEVNPSNDTTMLEVPEGTQENDGLAKWGL